MSIAIHTAPPAQARTMRWHLLALVPLALTAWVYHPIMRVFFFADDFLHLGRILNARALTFVLEPYGGHNYLVRNLVFLGSWHLFGLHAELWYGIVLLTHLLNVWLLFGVLGNLTGSVPLACLGATIWGTCPLAAGTLGFYSVYGQVMAATVLLVVLDQLVRLGAVGKPLAARTGWLWYGLLLAGTTCFGTGIGVALVFPLVLFLLLPPAWRQPRVRLGYLALPVVTLAAYFGLKRLYELLEPLTTSEALHVSLAAHGLAVAPGMIVNLLGVGVAGTTLGFFFELRRYPDARAGMAIAGFAAGLGLVAWRGDWKTRRAAVAMVALAVAVYAVIAVGRANAYYSIVGILPAQAAAEARYHYTATIPIAVLLCQILQQAGRIGSLSAIPRSLALAAGLCVLVAGYAWSDFRIDDHADARSYVDRTAREIAEAVAGAPSGTAVRLENRTTPPSVLGLFIPNLVFPGRAAVFLATHPSGRLDGRDVRFVERDPAIREAYQHPVETPLGRLLVAPEDAPAQP